MNNYENLQKVLKEIFEMDKADLDSKTRAGDGFHQ